MNLAPRAFLRALFEAAVAAASPARCVPPALPDPPSGRTIVVGAGKAAAAMARAVEDHWPAPLSGLVITRYGHSVPCRSIEVIEAGHPLPDEAGVMAAGRTLSLVQGLSQNDLVLALISGGGSSLLAVPASGLTLDHKQGLTRALLKSGAPIAEINCVRKHLSAIKGGRLALACAPARVLGLIISDVPGDDPAVVASGPTAPDPTTRQDALSVLDRHGVPVPAAVRSWLEDPASETPKPGDPAFARVENRVIARGCDALLAAERASEAMGIPAVNLGDSVEGEARALASDHAAEALRRLGDKNPVLLISGGETTVKVGGDGRGGRNGEYALALALALEGAAGIWAIACDTDGIDGTETNAGALIGPDTLARAKALGLDARAHLARNDSFGFFRALGDLVETGPTRTNVNDFRAVFVCPA